MSWAQSSISLAVKLKLGKVVPLEPGHESMTFCMTEDSGVGTTVLSPDVPRPNEHLNGGANRIWLLCVVIIVNSLGKLWW